MPERKVAEDLQAASPFAHAFLASCVERGLSEVQTLQAVKAASAIPEAAEEFQKVAWGGIKGLLQALSRGTGSAARGTATAAGKALPVAALAGGTGLGAVALDDYLAEKNPALNNRTGTPVPAKANPLHEHAPRVEVPPPADPWSPNFGKLVGHPQLPFAAPPTFGGFPNLPTPGGFQISKTGIDRRLLKMAVGEMPPDPSMMQPGAPPPGMPGQVPPPGMPPGMPPGDPSQQPPPPPAAPAVGPAGSPLQTTTGQPLPAPGQPSGPPAGPPAAAPQLPPPVPRPPHPQEAGLPAYPVMSKAAWWPLALGAVRLGSMAGAGSMLAGVGSKILGAGKNVGSWLGKTFGGAPKPPVAAAVPGAGTAAAAPAAAGAAAKPTLSSLFPNAKSQPHLDQLESSWAGHTPEVRADLKARIIAGNRNRPDLASQAIKHLDSTLPAESSRFGRIMGNPIAQTGIMMGGMMGLEPAINAFRGPDQGQEQAAAARTVGMHLSQAAAMGDENAFSQVVGQPGLHPQVAAGLQAMWGDRHGRQALASPDAAANAVFMMHQHLQTNPNLTGAQLAQVVGAGMKTAGSLAEEVGGLVGAYRAPEGRSTEGYGRGALQGKGWDVGGGLGGLAGGVGGGLLGHAWDRAQPAKPIPVMRGGHAGQIGPRALIGALLGLTGGSFAGGLAGVHVARKMQGPATYASPPQKQANRPINPFLDDVRDGASMGTPLPDLVPRPNPGVPPPSRRRLGISGRHAGLAGASLGGGGAAGNAIDRLLRKLQEKGGAARPFTPRPGR